MTSEEGSNAVNASTEDVSALALSVEIRRGSATVSLVDLSRFDAIGFQDLAAALAVAEFGHAVRPMGAGRDGGRDYIHEGSLQWTSPGLDGEQTADGYTVFQSKFNTGPSTNHQENVAWLWNEVRDELRDWAERTDRKRVPDTLIFVTNVALTPFPESGGFDTITAKVKKYIARAQELPGRTTDEEEKSNLWRQARRLARIGQVLFWDHHQIDALVNAHQRVRLAFNAFLTAGDVLAAIPQLLGLVPESELESALKSHARTMLLSGGRIYFDEAGGSASEGLPVHKVAVDLPVLVPNDGSSEEQKIHKTSAIPYLLERSGRMLKPSLSQVSKPRHVILAGQPGNGKSTLSKMIVQAHRAAFLRESNHLSDDQRALISETDSALRKLGTTPPAYPRWPVQINLAEYAQDDAVDLSSTLIRRIARDVSAKSDAGDITPSLLARWRNRWPWLLVLDGLDEVVDPVVRHSIIEQVIEFANNSEAEDADVLIILTTRPLGFNEEIGEGMFERIDLASLTPDTALEYGKKVTSVRLKRDPDRRDAVIERLVTATADDAFENLLRTPLQVLILSIIVEQSGELSPDRFSLFDGYFHTILTREKQKIGGHSSLIRDHETLIQEIHQRVGIELQIRAEKGATTRSVISHQELQDITWAALEREGFQPGATDRRLLKDLQDAATHRLVLLAPHGTDGYGFDVRSLQEYMAGLFLTSSTDATVASRLQVISASPHWRNTWLFAAGGLFVRPGAHLQELVVEVIETVDQDAAERLSTSYPAGPRLALDVLDDGMARARPRWLARLVDQALRPGAVSLGTTVRDLTYALVRIAAANDSSKNTVSSALRVRRGAAGAEGKLTAAILEHWITACDDLGITDSRVRGISQVKAESRRQVVPSVGAGRPVFIVDELSLEEVNQVKKALEAVRQDRGSLKLLKDALQVKKVARMIDAELSTSLLNEPRTRRRIETEVIPSVTREPKGHLLV